MAALSVVSSVALGRLKTCNVGVVDEAKAQKCWGPSNCRTTTELRSQGLVSNSWAHRRVLRPWVVRVSGEGLLTTDPASGVDSESERERLEAQLFAQIEASPGNLSEDCIATIEELGKFNPNPEPLARDPELTAGYWHQIRGTPRGTGRKGEGKQEVGYVGASVTLGRATFNAFKPGNLDIVLGEVYNYVGKLGAEDESTYELVIMFSTKNPKGEDLPPIEGLIINTAEQHVESSSRMGIEFCRAKIRPCYPDRDLEAWKEIFGEYNSQMDDIGQVFWENPQPHKGHLDFIYITDNKVRITKGNLGGYFVVRRVEAPPAFLDTARKV